MAAFAGPVKGRAVAVKRGAAAAEVLIAGVRTKGVSINGEPIDVTNDDDAGWRKYLEDSTGEKSVSITVAGVVKDHTLLVESLADDRVQSTIFEWPLTGGQATKDKLTGNFALVSYSENGEYKDGFLFEAEFQSSGQVTFTAGA